MSDQRFLAAARILPILHQQGSLEEHQSLLELIVQLLFRYVNAEDVASIEFFFSTGLQELVENEEDRREIMNELVQRVLMEVVRNGPNLDKVSPFFSCIVFSKISFSFY